ncbi:unnamed protein product [Merluccius merluccius]
MMGGRGSSSSWLAEEVEALEGFCKFSCIAGDVNQDSSMKTALFAATAVGMMFGLMFLLVRYGELLSP